MLEGDKMRNALLAIGLLGCQNFKFSETDSLAGWWERDLSCQGRDFFVQSQIENRLV